MRREHGHSFHKDIVNQQRTAPNSLCLLFSIYHGGQTCVNHTRHTSTDAGKIPNHEQFFFSYRMRPVPSRYFKLIEDYLN